MSKLVVFESITLDGVMQAPGRPDEDRRGGFEQGGWGVAYSDPSLGRAAAEGMSQPGALLLGRRTYEDFYAVWPTRTDSPFSDVLNKRQKYVASRTLQEPLPWMNSTLLKGDMADAVSILKQQDLGVLTVLGSGELVKALMQHNLTDRYVLLIHPLVLGTGRRLFGDGAPPAKLALVDTKTTTNGVIVATYQTASS